MQDIRRIEEEIKKIKAIKNNRPDIVRAIQEYSTLVHDRSKYGVQSQDTDVFAVDESIQPFVNDAVKAAFSLIWNPAGAPFRIVHDEKSLNDFEEVQEYYKEVAWVLEKECNYPDTDFKYALEQCLKLMFEYGSAFMFVTRREKSFFCQALSLENIWLTFDTFRQIEKVVIRQRGDVSDLDTFIEKDGNHWVMYTPVGEKRYEETYYDYLPVFMLFSDPPDIGRQYPIGAGLSSLPEIRKLNDIITDLTRSAAALLKPIEYRDPAQNQDNRADDTATVGGRVVDLEIAGSTSHLPIGYVPVPSHPQPAWELWTQMLTRIREKFGSINRLLTLKDNVQITATEANIRSQTDLNQLKNLLDNIFSRFLNPIHNAQLKLLKVRAKDLPPLPGVLKGKQYNVTFYHNSIFQKAEERERAQDIQSAIGEFNNLIQVAANAKQSDLKGINFSGLATEITRLHNLPQEVLSHENMMGNLLSAFAESPPQQDTSPEAQQEQSPIGGLW